MPDRSPTARTLVLLKPDAVERRLVGTIVSRFESRGLTIAAMELRTLDADTLARHYAEHVGKGFYDDLVAFMSRGPVVAMVVEGPDDTWEVVRDHDGCHQPSQRGTGHDPRRSRSGVTENLVHGSDSPSRPPVRSPSSSRICNLRPTERNAKECPAWLATTRSASAATSPSISAPPTP